MKSKSLKSIGYKTAIFGVASLMLGLSQAAVSQASLVVQGGSFDLGQGFGAVDNILTMHEVTSGAGDATDIEAGGVSWNGSADVYSGDADTNPIKTATFTFDYLGITDASQILFIWDPAEVGNGTETQIDVLTMDIYAPTGGSVFTANLDPAIDPVFFDDVFNPGVGGGDFVFVLDDAQSTTLQAILAGFGDFGDYRIGLSSSASFIDDGPDTWLVGRGPGNPVIPEPATMLLFGIGITGLAGFARRKK